MKVLVVQPAGDPSGSGTEGIQPEGHNGVVCGSEVTFRMAAVVARNKAALCL